MSWRYALGLGKKIRQRLIELLRLLSLWHMTTLIDDDEFGPRNTLLKAFSKGEWSQKIVVPPEHQGGGVNGAHCHTERSPRRQARRGGLILVENKQKADPSCRLQQGLQVEIGTSLRSE
jgi:hypothetical protein